MITNINKSVVITISDNNNFIKKIISMEYIKYDFFDKRFIDFVVRENYKYHHFSCDHDIMKTEINEIHNEEQSYEGKKTFVFTDDKGNINGTIRVLKWNYKDILPIQKIFKINPVDLMLDDVYGVYHIGRFAIKKEGNHSIITFKTLMMLAINEVLKEKKSFVLAECDTKLLKLLNRLGIETIKLSEAVSYLGSETIPVLLLQEGLKKFYNNNIKLLNKLHYSVVLEDNINHYTIV
ncbi:hypothetical protein [Riemerella columbina]|uniref:hypothetical protein n=1 Tax=Riemerella columbina TaxID=103810 RepID=UPI000366A7F3|nr:hypothetical protein [Riemerella columbina]